MYPGYIGGHVVGEWSIVAGPVALPALTYLTGDAVNLELLAHYYLYMKGPRRSGTGRLRLTAGRIASGSQAGVACLPGLVDPLRTADDSYIDDAANDLGIGNGYGPIEIGSQLQEKALARLKLDGLTVISQCDNR